jgi:hypothetical protein
MERRKRLWATLGLVALALVDIALVFAALRITGRTAAGDQSPATSVTQTDSPAPTSEGTPAPATSTSPGPSTETATGSPAAGVPLTLLVAAVDGSSAWRATVGACSGGGASVQVSADGGKTWRSRTSPYPVVMRIQASDASKAFAVGADGSCGMGVRSTTDGGATWPGTVPLAGTLSRDAKDATKVRAPGGRTVAPCGGVAVVDLARNSATGAQVLCADGKLLSSVDDGATWTDAGSVPGALALDSKPVGSSVTAFVARSLGSCEGVQLSTVVDGNVTDVGCAGVGQAEPGKVALSVPTPQTGWLLVGTTTWRSTDGLKTWAKA